MYLLNDKIKLRSIELTDNELLRNLINDPDIEYYIGGKSFPISEYDQEQWIKNVNHNNEAIRYMLEELKEKRTVGMGAISDINYINGTAQIHIKLVKKFQGKGYGKEAVECLLKYCFNELRLQCVYAYIIEYNLISVKLFEKCGFKKEGVLRNRIYKNGSYYNQLAYSKLKRD